MQSHRLRALVPQPLRMQKPPSPSALTAAIAAALFRYGRNVSKLKCVPLKFATAHNEQINIKSVAERMRNFLVRQTRSCSFLPE